jgi:hypothetical protein
MDFANLNKQRKFILIAALVGVISIFLPWISISGFGMSISANGFHSYGIMVFIAFIAAGIVAIMGDQTKPLDQAMWLVELAAGAVALIFAFLSMSNLSGGESFGAGFGIGSWLAILSALGVVGSAWLLKSPGDSLQEGFESLKGKVATAAGPANPPPSATAAPSKVAELERLIKLKEEGKITEEEYQEMKGKIM